MRLRASAAAPLALALSACQPATPAAPPATPAPAPATATPSAPVHATPMLTAPPPPLGANAVVFTLHKLLAEIGTERDTYTALPGGGTEAKAVFAYRDRGAMVPLAATFDFGPDGALARYSAWGRTSRFTEIDDRVDALDGAFQASSAGSPARTVSPDGPAIAASGYAPILAQDLMLRAWNEHGRPAKMAMLPAGEVTIESRGKETYDGEPRTSGKRVTLEHVAIGGLVWGREDAWLAEDGSLAAVITRDAEFDPHEASREGFDRVLPELTRAAGIDGVAWLATAARGTVRSAPGAQAFVGGNLIDGTGRPAVKDAVVVVDGDRIVAAGPRASTPVPAGATTIDVTGKSIIPGLWDMHAHVSQVEQGVVYLAAGVTTVRDMGNVLGFITGMRDAIDGGPDKALGPRVLVAAVVDGSGRATMGTTVIDKRAEIAPTLDRLKKAGALQVKIYQSVDPDLLAPIVAYAHAHGMGAVGHVPTGATSQQAIDVGYDSISHVSNLLDAALPASAMKGLGRDARYAQIAAVDLSSPAMTRELASLAARHVVIDDTLALLELHLHTEAENATREPGIATLPRELAGSVGGAPPALATPADAAFAKYLALVGELHKRGVALVAGTDIAVPGHTLHRELELYVKAGMTPMEAIQAATLVPARFMHLDKELGTVEAGKRADFVVLDGDPLADVSNVRKTKLVVARGRAYDSAALWKIVGFRSR